MSEGPLKGLTVVGFESRMADATASLIRKRGGRAMPAPSLQEVPLDEQDAVFDFAEALLKGTFDLVYFNTAVGTRMVLETLDTQYELETIRAALDDGIVVSRSPKPGRVLKEYDLPIDVKTPEPHTWRTVLETLTARPEMPSLEGKRMAIHEYGQPNEELNEALRSEGVEIVRVPVYRWELPDDLQPLRNGIRALIGGEAQIALFTSRQQVSHVLQVAEERGWEGALRTALHEDAMVASVGPVTSEKLRANDLPVHFEPDRSKLAILVKGLAEYAPEYFQQPA